MTVLDYFLPESLDEALRLLERHGDELLVVSGGTVAMPLVNEGISLPERVMGLRRAGVDGVALDGDALRIGAAAPLSRLLDQDAVPLLRSAAANTASWSIRNVGTVGGNLFTPPPGGDVAVALLALGTRLRIAGPRGARDLDLEDFYTGFMRTAVAADELLVEIIVPTVRRETAYIKLGRKHANTPAVVTVAVALDRVGGLVRDPRITLGAVAAHPMRARAAEDALAGSALDAGSIRRAADAAAGECEAFTDAIATAWYRRRMVGVVVRQALERLRDLSGGRAGEGR